MAFQENTQANAVLNSEIAATRRAFDKIGAFFGGMFSTVVQTASARYRYETLTELRGKSDEELAKMGLRRDNVVNEVFGDKYYA